MNFDEKVACLQLLQTPKIGRVTFFHLIEYFKSAKAAVDGLQTYVNIILKKQITYNVPLKSKVLKFIEDCKKSQVKLVFYSDAEYPKEFLLAYDYPPVLFCKGNVSLLNKECLAVVGSRAASLQGMSFAKKLINELQNLCIVSGFAKGIDSIAHEASLKNGTIAVLGSGVNHIYPAENKELYEKILNNNGLIISEIGLNDIPKGNFFAYRNRLISGISKGLLVVEAAMNSGSLITAKYALEQGKNIFAVPGHPYDIRSFGTNYLIKQGAILVRNAQDILSEFYSYTSGPKQSYLFNIAEVEIEEVSNWILGSLGIGGISIAEIFQNSKYSIGDINGALAYLELSGLIEIEYGLVRRII